MTSTGWKMTSTGWKMTSTGWKMTSTGWKMTSTGWKMTREERRLAEKGYARQMQNDQLPKMTAAAMMHGTCMSISSHAFVLQKACVRLSITEKLPL